MLLKVNGISKHFGGITAVNDVSFELKEAELVALIGPNGAGKTSLFNIISGLQQPDRGSILYQGKEMAGLKTFQMAQAGITRTFQNLQLFKGMTVLENVMTGAYLKGTNGFLKSIFSLPGKSLEEKVIREKAEQLLREIGLHDSAQLPASALPFGKQRLLEIARALASDPGLVLLDEPAAGLNHRETEILTNYLIHLKNKKFGVILIEHDMATVMEAADKIVVLNFGKVLAEGTPSEIQANTEVIKAYLGEDEQIA